MQNIPPPPSQLNQWLKKAVDLPKTAVGLFRGEFKTWALIVAPVVAVCAVVYVGLITVLLK